MIIEVSVIIPVYNCENYIERCVKSIMGQTVNVDKIEIIIVDDGSTDESARICDDLQEQYAPIRVLHQDNKGVSAARNCGLKEARGKYVAFIDADDYIPADAFELMLDAKDGDLIVGNVISIGILPKLMFLKKRYYTPSTLAQEIMTSFEARLVMSGVWGKLFKKSIISDFGISFNENLQNGEDGMFVADYLNVVNTITTLTDKTPIYYLVRYAEEERISAVAAFYPDFYSYYIDYVEVMNELMEPSVDRKNVYQAFINELIIYLVRAYAYAEFFEAGELFNSLQSILHTKWIREAISSYKRKTVNESKSIFLTLKAHNSLGLDIALKIRAKKYISERGKTTNIKSVKRERK